jgi:hypothetical protein
MIRSLAISTAAICLLTSTAFAAPTTMTDAQMAQIVAGIAHQGEQAPLLRGGVAELMPAHVLGLGEGEFPGEAHQSSASGLKGGVADLMPGHVL